MACSKAHFKEMPGRTHAHTHTPSLCYLLQRGQLKFLTGAKKHDKDALSWEISLYFKKVSPARRLFLPCQINLDYHNYCTISTSPPDFCGLITIELPPCDTLCMMKPSREPDCRRKGAQLKCCNRFEGFTNTTTCN